MTAAWSRSSFYHRQSLFCQWDTAPHIGSGGLPAEDVHRTPSSGGPVGSLTPNSVLVAVNRDSSGVGFSPRMASRRSYDVRFPAWSHSDGVPICLRTAAFPKGTGAVVRRCLVLVLPAGRSRSALDSSERYDRAAPAGTAGRRGCADPRIRGHGESIAHPVQRLVPTLTIWPRRGLAARPQPSCTIARPLTRKEVLCDGHDEYAGTFRSA